MKLKKTLAAILAATTITAPYGLYGTTSRVASDVYAEDTGAVAQLPDWIPNDFDSALSFSNRHGGVRIANGLIGVVSTGYYRPGRSEDTYGFDLNATEDMGQILKNEIYTSDEAGAFYQVFVYQPMKQGDLRLKVVDPHVQVPPSDNTEEPFESPAVSEYTFSVGSDLSVTETDIYAWLPDCAEEYTEYVTKNGEVSVKDNYLVFCRESGAGTPYRWEGTQTPEEFEDAAFSDCSEHTSVPLDGGTILEVIAYKAVKDGSAVIQYQLLPQTAGESVSKKLKADCIITDNAQKIVLGSNARISLIDSDTGELIDVDETTGFSLRVMSRTVMDTTDIAALTSNPCILSTSAYYFDGGITLTMPAGYTIPYSEETNTLPSDFESITKYENGAYDIVYRIKKSQGADLPAGATRVMFVDSETGKLIPEHLLENHPCSFETDLILDDPTHPGTSMSYGNLYTLKTNPEIFTDDLAAKYLEARSCRIYRTRDPETVLYDNGSMDMIFRTTIRVSGNINGDYDFNIADAVTLKNWLLGKPDAELENWEQADFTLDNQIDTFDLCLMMKKLVYREENAPVAVSITAEGGYDGVHIEYNIFKENDNYYFTAEEIRYSDNEKRSYALTEEQYHEIMTADYEGMAADSVLHYRGPVMDGFEYRTTLKYEDGTEKKYYTETSEVLNRIYAMETRLIAHS
ncbi:MAG: dockerin type I repeat-containing protein [Ruminococcus sp.]|nr:dockerin type I repeat-containing protein [Ruminococcus sp.]